MSVAANLDVNLRGNTQGLDKATDMASKSVKQAGAHITADLSRVESRFTHLSVHVQTVSAGMGKALAVATGGLTLLTGALAGFMSTRKILEATDALDSLGDSATKIGIGTEALAGFQHAANLTGVSAESLEKALVKLGQNLSEIGGGGGDKARKAISDLKLDDAALRAGNLGDAATSLFQALEKVGNSNDRLRITKDLFGKAGAELIPLIAESGELGEKLKEASEIGLAATQAQVAEAGAANDAIDTMKSAFKGLFRTVAIAVAPFVRDFAEGVTNAIKYLISFKDTLFRVFRQGQFVLENFGEYWDVAFDTALYTVVKWYNNVENLFTSALPTIFKEGLDLLSPALDAAGANFAYWIVRLTNMVIHFATEVLPEGFKQGFLLVKEIFSGDFAEATAKAISTVWEKLNSRQEGEMEADVRRQAEKMAAALDSAMQGVGDRINRSLTRPEGAIEGAMRQSIEAKTKQLAERMNKFVDEKMDAMNTKKKKAGGEGELAGGESKTGNAAVERGSQQALALIAKKNDERALAAMNKQLFETKKHTELLQKIARKHGIARANV